MMEKSSSSSPKSPPRDIKSTVDPHAAERDSLLVRLLDSVKQCQIRFGKKSALSPTSTATAASSTALATEAEAQVICLLTNLEAALSHGLRQNLSGSSRPLGGLFSSSDSAASSSSGARPTFWHFIRAFLGPDELVRFDGNNSGVSTDLGRGRAWLRTTINENTLERYFYSLVNDREKIKTHYEPWSFMLDEEKSSVLPSMAAGLKTILFNVSTEGPELDHVPKSSAPTAVSGAQNILNSIPLGGIIRDTILSTSLSSSVPNGKGAGFSDAYSSAAYGDGSRDYLEPVIIDEVPRGNANESESGVAGKTSSVSSSSSSYSNSEKISQSVLVTKKSAGKKKKKTVANIVNLDGNEGASSLQPQPQQPLRTQKQPPSTTTTSTLTSASRPALRQRLSDPPSALVLPVASNEGMAPAATTASLRRDSDLSVENNHCKSSSSSCEMRFVGGGGCAGDVLSPITPVTSGAPNGLFSTTPTIAISKEKSIADGQDGDSSDAVSVKSFGQVSVASSSTSELSTSATFPNINATPSLSSALTTTASNSKAPAPSQNSAPTLLSLRDGRLGVEVLRSGSGVSAFNSDNDSLGTTKVSTTELLPRVDAEFETLSAAELRGAIVSIMQSKDELVAALEENQGRLSEARDQIEDLRLENASGRELARKLERKIAEAEVNGDNKSKFLLRENQLLKHQLKKYVGTVQSLQRQKSSADDIDGGGGVNADGVNAVIEKMSLEEEEDGGRRSGSVVSATDGDDVDQIRKSYEQKLIQVSEMHSELMEFNDQLVMQLKQKDRLLEGLRVELEELRGPLPLNYAAENADDTLSLASEVDDIVSISSSALPNSASSCSFRALVNIWIPSAFLQTTNKDTFHVYQVYVRIRDEEWNVYRRYAQFHELHKAKKKMFSDVATIPFPPKKALGNKDEQFVEDRRIKLQQYLRQLLNYLTQCTGYELAHAHPITKERLLQALPFFSDRPTSGAGSQSGRFHASTSRSRFPTAEEPTTPQYMGL